jgi:DNA mismatch repair protein MutL
MARLRQLPPDVITKIAAGEVIERPASVVKELLENAVDAGASRIDVEVDNGGVDLIRVVDDGCGIAAEDLPLAFASHATSKLAKADDLFRIASLGFRGEALASIGGVAQAMLQSRPVDQASGAEIACHGGRLSPPRPWNGSPGTRIEVRNLFFNTPVRRKFLRSTTTEMGHISEVFTRLALAHPTLHITLRHNGKAVYEVPASAGIKDRIGIFFSGELRDRIYTLEAQQGPVLLRGFIGDPADERGNPKMQYLFVNGRWIRDRSLGHALQEAYRGLLMTGRYAVAFLFLQLPPDQVDVNVHPTKAEVRFRDAHALYHLVFASIRERLQKQDLTGRLRLPPTPFQAIKTGFPHPSSPPPVGGGLGGGTGFGQHLNPAPWSLSSPQAFSTRLPFASGPAMPEPPGAPNPVREIPMDTDPGTGKTRESAIAGDVSQDPEMRPSSGPNESTGSQALKVIQLYNAYLVAETPEGMLVIDQHALHERILFEQLKRRLQVGSLETQRLLMPEPVDLPAEQAARALEHRDELGKLGLELEDFGGGTLLLTSYPAILGNRPPQAILKTVVDHLVSKDRAPNRDQLLNDLLSLMACHAAVKAGDRLTPEEIAALVAQRDLVNDTHHCPHGRPTSLLLSRQELDRQFRRT